MDDNEVQHIVLDLEGVRMICVVFPRTIGPTTMAEGFSKYLTLWEVESPTVVFVDVRQLATLPPDARNAIGVLLRRVGVIPSFIASAWLCGDNPVAHDFRELLDEAGRDVETVFRDELAAIEYLRERVIAWREGRNAE